MPPGVENYGILGGDIGSRLLVPRRWIQEVHKDSVGSAYISPKGYVKHDYMGVENVGEFGFEIISCILLELLLSLYDYLCAYQINHILIMQTIYSWSFPLCYSYSTNAVLTIIIYLK